MCLSKLIGGGGGGAGPPPPPQAMAHAMALINITLFGKRIKNSFFLSKMYSLLSKIPFLFFFLLFFSLLLKIFHFSFSTLNSHGMVPGLFWNPGTFKCSFFFCATDRPTITRDGAMGNETCYWDGLIAK